MARISGVDLPSKKRAVIALTYIHGVGNSRAAEICEKANISKDVHLGDLKQEEIARLRKIIEESYAVEGQLRTQVSLNIKRLMEINSYRGRRHRMHLPLTGRTRSNAKTCKRKGGRKRMAVAGKKPAGKK